MENANEKQFSTTKGVGLSITSRNAEKGYDDRSTIRLCGRCTDSHRLKATILEYS